MKGFLRLISAFFVLALCLSVWACNKSADQNNAADISGITLNDAAYTYDGSEKVVEIQGALPEGIRVEYTDNKATDAGSYLVKAKLYNGDELIKILSATLTINKAVYDMSTVTFPHVTHAYTGEVVEPTIVGTLPDGVSVKYNCSSQIKNAGTYNITAEFNGDKNHEDIPPMKSVYTITKATYDMSGVAFPDVEVAYTGKKITPELIGNLPSGVTVRFRSTPSTILEAGTYTVTASFSGDYVNYNSIPDMTATYTVTRQSHDMSGVSLPSVTVSYTGEVITPKIIGTLPDGVTCTISSIPSVIKEAGTYTVTATFKSTNPLYESIPDMTATYTVKKAVYDMSGVSLPSVTLIYSGKEITPYIVGTLPDGVSCYITSNPEVIKEPGKYTVIAHFHGSEYYEIIPNMIAIYTINSPEYIDGSIAFELLNNGTYEVTGYIGSSDTVVIPSEHQGKAVTSIRSSAFINNTSITYVYVPSSVTNIGNKAFKNCSSLSTAVIESGVKVIGAEAFANTALGEISLPDSLESIGQGAFLNAPLSSISLPFVGGSRLTSNAFIGYLFGALTYAGNEAKVPETLTSVAISGSATEIPAYSFYGVKSLCTVTIGEGIARIGNSAFAGCSSLCDVYIPDTVNEIPANAYAYNSPFYGCNDNLMIVIGAMSADNYGKYWSNYSDNKQALVVYYKTYEDYLKNKNEYRDFDMSNANLSFITVNGAPLTDFNSDTLSYSLSADINEGYPRISAIAQSPISNVLIDQPSAKNGGVATVTVTSADGSSVKVYTLSVALTGSFSDVSAEVVGKDGTTGTVTFVVDDGDHPTAEFTMEMMEKYPQLKFTYAILTSRLATLNTEYDPATGKYKYVMTEDGKYAYSINQAEVDFWNNILNSFDAEVISHTHTHAFWGIDDRGGVQQYVTDGGVVKSSGNLPIGSSYAEIYAAIQIIEELLNIRAITHTVPGIGVQTEDKIIDGVTYTTYNTYYQSLLNTALANGDIINLIGNVMGTNAQSVTKYVTKDNIKQQNGVARLMVRPTDDTSLWKQFISNAANNNGWATYCIHKISPSATSGHYILESDAEELFEYAVSSNVWIANYTEAALYYNEWASAKVSVSYTDGKINVTLTDSEDNSVYDEALTVKISVPNSWEFALVGSELVDVHVNDDGRAFIYANIVPDSGIVQITSALK